MRRNAPAVSRAVSWLRRTVLAGTADDLLEQFQQQHYAESTTALYLRLTAHFGQWLDGRQLAVTDVSEALITDFVQHHLPRCGCAAGRVAPRINRDAKSAHAALRHVAEALRRKGKIAGAQGGFSLPPAVQDALDELDQHLQHVRGIAVATRGWYRRYIGSFLVWRFGVAAVVPAALSAQDLRRFLVSRSRACSAGTAGVIATALRAYLRYLVFRGQATAQLVEAVPAVARWRQGRLPQHLEAAQEADFLRTVDQTVPSGRRDYAAFLLMCRLGLRVSDVAALTLDDLDWRHGTLSVHAAKTGRTHLLPLPCAVAEAIVAYLRYGRPCSQDRHVFVRHRAPMGRPVTAGLLRGAVRRAYARAGFPACWTGTHRLRHTAAASMLRGGATIKQIADVLAHRSIDTTAIYAKIDLESLREVPLPWPGRAV